MANLNLGIMKPEYLARAQRLSEESFGHQQTAVKAAAMSKHPVVRSSGRSSEFLGSAKAHLEASHAAHAEFRRLPKMQGEQFTGRNANFESGRANALEN